MSSRKAKTTKRQKRSHRKLFAVGCGFILKFFLARSLFYVLRDVFDFSLAVALLVTASIALTLTLLFLFHKTSRCVMLLMIPQTFSKRGRIAVITYTFIIAFSGPARNLFVNVDVLSTSFSCGQV